MDRMLYVAMSGAKQLMQAQTLISNNLANAATSGFRADLARFDAAEVRGPGFPSRVNTVAAGAGFDHAPGEIVHTGRELDVAVNGSGWIAVQAGDGTEAYTRDGGFRLNALGLLETRRGEFVLGDSGPVAVPPHESVQIGRDGTVSIVPQGQGAETLAEVGRIKLVDPEPELLGKRPDGLVQLADGEAAPADAGVTLTAGSIETSNVNAAATLVGMIEAARQFDLGVRIMRAADENAARAAELVRLG